MAQEITIVGGATIPTGPIQLGVAFTGEGDISLGVGGAKGPVAVFQGAATYNPFDNTWSAQVGLGRAWGDYSSLAGERGAFVGVMVSSEGVYGVIEGGYSFPAGNTADTPFFTSVVYTNRNEITNWDEVSESIADLLDYLDSLFGSPGDATPVSDALASAGQWFGDSLHSPLVFDLGGQGLDLLPLSGSPTFFDFDGDLFKEQAGWVKPTDGFLVVDRNGNGVIDNRTEMFAQDSTGSAWDKLRVYDTNGSGIISGTERNPLRIWQDFNGNGISETNELKTLTQAGITSINVTRTDRTFGVQGHSIDGQGSWTHSSGVTRNYYDVFFKTSQVNSWYVGADTSAPPEVDIETLFLPLSRGYGDMKSLHLAMTEDAGLKGAMEALITSTSYATLHRQVEALLYD